MNYKKLALVGCISALVAVLTSLMGVTGTIIGSVISSVLYNMLTEALEKPIGNKSFTSSFEWELAYIFPIAVIAIIQLLLILALLAEQGTIPYTFANVYLSIQDAVNNNLYRILGLALLVMAGYSFVLKRVVVKKVSVATIVFVGLIFLARGFVDWGNSITELYGTVFQYFDLPIAIVAFGLLCGVILSILIHSRDSDDTPNVINHKINEENFSTPKVHKVRHSKIHKDFDYAEKGRSLKESFNKSQHNLNHEKTIKKEVKLETGINTSSENIQFESNDLLDEYK